MRTIIVLLLLLPMAAQAAEVRVVILVEDQEGEIQSLVAEAVPWLPDTVELCNYALDTWYRENMIVSLLHRSAAEGEVINVSCVDWEPVLKIFEQLREGQHGTDD